MRKNNETDTKLSTVDHGICGAVSGTLTRAAAQPLDVLKIRFQLQSEPIRARFVNNKVATSKYSGILQAAYLISKEEGLRAFWKGHVPAQVLSLVYGSVQFVTFEFLQNRALKITRNRENRQSIVSALHFIFGGIAGTSATICCHPLDVIRTRFVAQGEPKVYTSLLHGVVSMSKEGGVRTFYKGLIPTLFAIFPNASFQFGFYNLLKISWQRYENKNESQFGKIQSIACGAVSGIISKLLVLPFDVVKKRLQIQGFEDARKSFGRITRYTGMWHCFLKIVSEEGIMGLFKGSSASVLKSTLVVGLTFFTYEQCCSSMQKTLINKT